jgi:trans-aconitate methyltransferase
MKFSDQDKKRLRDYYVKSLNAFGINSAMALNWAGEESQFIRFQALSGIGDFDQKRILDVGSGLGDLYHFLSLSYRDFDYLGIDIVPELVEKAKIKYPGVKFQVFDVLDFQGKSFDYVLASGALSFKVPDHKEKYFKVIEKMFSLTKIGLAFNMLDASGHIDDETFAAYNSKEVFELCRKIAPKVELINTYSPQDFTIYMYR